MSSPDHKKSRDGELDAPPAQDSTEASGRAADEVDPQVPTPPSEAKLTEQIVKLEAEKEDLLHTWVRRQADFENYRKRIERERREDRERITAALVEQLFPVLDGFERALAAHREPAYEEYRKGFELLFRQLLEILTRQGLTRFDALGQSFDPHYHHAVEKVESGEYPDGTVIEQLQPGYKLGNRVLRPAMVRVAVHPAVPRTSAGSEVN